MSKDTPKQRTNRQNAAMHLYFTQLAEALNDSGLDMRVVLKPEIAIPWTPTSIKEQLWRPVQRLQLDKRSTTELTTKDLTQSTTYQQAYRGTVRNPYPISL